MGNTRQHIEIMDFGRKEEETHHAQRYVKYKYNEQKNHSNGSHDARYGSRGRHMGQHEQKAHAREEVG